MFVSKLIMDDVTEKIGQADLDQEELKKMGRLLASISGEFEGWQVKVVESDPNTKNVEVTAEFSSQDKNIFLLGVQTASRTLLSRTTEVEFQYRIPHSKPGKAEIHLNHTGSWSRTGIKASVKEGGAEAQRVADKLTADKQFYAAFFPLDSKHFHLVQDSEGWQVKTSQMGAAWLAIKFPPTRRYIPMGADQVETLIGCFVALNKILG